MPKEITFITKEQFEAAFADALAKPDHKTVLDKKGSNLSEASRFVPWGQQAVHWESTRSSESSNIGRLPYFDPPIHLKDDFTGWVGSYQDPSELARYPYGSTTNADFAYIRKGQCAYQEMHDYHPAFRSPSRYGGRFIAVNWNKYSESIFEIYVDIDDNPANRNYVLESQNITPNA